MNDSIHPDNDRKFADQLERDLRLLEENSNGFESDSDDKTSAEISARVQKVKPVLELLNEFKDRPEFVAGHAEVETGDAVGDVTHAVTPELPVPQLSRLGRFEIIREVGKGGNGIVLAARDTQLNRDVAVKIPRLSAALSGESKLRFEREAKAAASLSHPGIVPIYEVGHDQGVDFIVSELVNGISLTDWLEQHDVSALQSAACVSSLAEAIQHAHQRGVWHRDLKPSNIIVAKGSGNGDLASRFRIVDFGLAAVHDDTNHDLTNTGAMLGTPAYMSPEQTRTTQDGIGESTDVYGLGVILYQMLTHQAPFSGSDLIQLVEKIRTQEPITADKLNPSVPRDLAAIVSKCLEKRAMDRYPTAADLHDDLERFLNNEPVVARPASAPRRLAKWVQRNPWGSAVIVTLLIGVLATSYAAIRAAVAEKKSRLAEDKALVEAEVANEVADFLEAMFQIPKTLTDGQSELRGSDVTAEQILMHAAEKIVNGLESQPKVKARLMTLIGASLTDVGSYGQAEELLRKGLELNVGLLDRHDSRLAQNYQYLSRLLRHLDQDEEAESHLRASIEILEEDVETHHRQLANCYNDLGILLRPHDPMASREAYCTSRDIIEKYQTDQKDNWKLSANIAVSDYLSGRYELAAEAFARALDHAVETHGELDPQVAVLHGNFSKVYLKLRHFEKAKASRLKDLEIATEVLGENHVNVGKSLTGLVEIQQRLGDLEDAFVSGERAIEILKTGLPANHRLIITAINNHTVTLIRMNRFEEALGFALEIEAADKARLGEQVDVQMLTNQLMISQVERRSGHYESAQSRIEFVLNHELSEKNKSIGANARLAKALLMSETGEPEAKQTMLDALAYTDQAGVLRKPDRAYFEAQFWALAGNQEKAIQKLLEAVEAGYRDARILSDPDFRNLEANDDFQDIKVRFANANDD